MYAHVMRDPARSIQLAKKHKTMKKTVSTLLEACIVLGLAAIIVSFRTLALDSVTTAVSIGVGVIAFVLLASIISAFVIEIVMHTLGGKGKYYEALTVISYSIVPISAGMLLSSIVLFVPSAGFLLAFMLLLPTVAMGIALVYKGVKELFKVDMITSYAGVTIMIMTEFVSLYLLVMLSLISGIGSVLV
jgi:hypothetical protein